jgi:hypothetical protein
MDQFTRRIVGFGIHGGIDSGYIDGSSIVADSIKRQ